MDFIKYSKYQQLQEYLDLGTQKNQAQVDMTSGHSPSLEFDW